MTTKTRSTTLIHWINVVPTRFCLTHINVTDFGFITQPTGCPSGNTYFTVS